MFRAFRRIKDPPAIVRIKAAAYYEHENWYEKKHCDEQKSKDKT